MENRRNEEDGREGKNEVSRSFSGWLSDIITARPSLLVFSLVPLLFPFFFFIPWLLSPSISTLSPFLVNTSSLPPLPILRLTVLSLSVPTGLRGQHGEISDQFFKPRVPRLYTSWETTLGWAQSETSTRLSGVGASVSKTGMRVKSSREEN